MTAGPTKYPPRRQTHRTIQRAQAVFIQALIDGASVTLAAAKAGSGRATVYEWRRDDAEFAAAWDSALESGTDRLEDEASRRAHDGVEEPLVSGGRLIVDKSGKPMLVRRYSDMLLRFLIERRRGDKSPQRIEMSGPDGGPIERTVIILPSNGRD